MREGVQRTLHKGEALKDKRMVRRMDSGDRRGREVGVAFLANGML